jgi:hypothetical protein
MAALLQVKYCRRATAKMASAASQRNKKAAQSARLFERYSLSNISAIPPW